MEPRRQASRMNKKGTLALGDGGWGRGFGLNVGDLYPPYDSRRGY